ncbi:MAG TPA: AI-2E family transporter [Fermentimonas caenicola]|jgi:predicted PurR-regulated permease PerM|uniref:AI-2E family transporter n=1 Tax=Lascolabacillus sp. TaxID=1924068 RepID=UPI00185D8AB2|nr:AI-2E family transporter [Lascolabacillus sp.]MBP6176558.1 AI-2E family transporter [Fermentimonas sp.]HHU41930.1 AI-2E family transporter [Fermentimonas caenicola]MBP6196074.1 AI-2E family transporter [Fermentimonas sp.]MBP7103923.1 AI-2E family transporter [Fermentimonas sp.]MDD3658878.1 AI-2E family transporter [Lascolabacillus sp.]
MSVELVKNSQKYRNILIGLIILLGLIIFRYTRPYMSGFLGAATLYILVVDQHRYLIQKLNFKKGLSAILIVLIVLIFILIPLTGIAFLVIDTFSSITIDPEVILGQINDFINSLEAKLGFNIFTPENLSALPRAGTNILQILGNSIYSFIINVVVILFVLYYMLYSNEEFEKAITEILPFKDENKEILIDETKLIIQANAIGIPLMAILQGLFAYMGYLLFGVNSALLYAILTAFATILPLVGTMIIWVPLGIGLLIGGDLVNGVGLIIYGLFIIGGVDNVARFLLQKKLADIHPLITVFGVLIGIPIFGFWGVIFGPLLLSLFILFFNMYRHEYVPGSKAEARVTTRLKAKKMKIPGYNPAKTKKKQKKNEVQSE